MKQLSAAICIFGSLLAGCGPLDVLETTYSDMTEVKSRGGISSGWIPSWLPDSATELHEIHNIDTNESALSFKHKLGTAWRPPAQCKLIPASEAKPSRYRQEWWPTERQLLSSYVFYRCPADASSKPVLVGVHNSGGVSVVWRVSAR